MSMGWRWVRGSVFALAVAMVFAHAIAFAQSPAAKQVPGAAMMVVQTTVVPNLVGRPESYVTDLLGPARLGRGSSSSRDSDRPAGTVLSQDPQAGSRVKTGTRVDVVVSSGTSQQPQHVDVPNVVGDALLIGELRLAKQHLRPGRVDREPASAASGTIVRQDPQYGSQVDAGTAIDLVVSTGQGSPEGQTRVPSVIKRPINDAEAILEKSGLRVGNVTRKGGTASSGLIIDQSPSQGTVVASGARVDLVVSAGNDGTITDGSKSSRVPDVVKHHFPEGDTPTILAQAGLHIGFVQRQNSSTPFGTILVQRPTAGSLVAKGSGVDLVVSGGAGTIAIPNVVGLSAAIASQRIQQARFVSSAKRVPGAQAEGTVVTQRPDGGVQANPGSEVAIEVSDGSLVVVPQLTGRNADSADAIVEKTGLRSEHTTQPSSAAPDTVVSQDPAAGTMVRRETTVRLVVAIARTIAVPDVVELSIADARARIGSGLKLETKRVDSAKVPVDHVVAQDPRAGTVVPVGTTVQVDVSLGTPPLPDFTGTDIDQARSDAKASGIPLGEPQRVFDPAKSGTVLRQSVAPNTRPAAGTIVTLVVSRGPLWPWIVTTIAAVAVLLVGAAGAALWPPVRYRVVAKNHKVSASTASLEIEGPSIEMRVRVEHGTSTLNESPEGERS